MEQKSSKGERLTIIGTSATVLVHLIIAKLQLFEQKALVCNCTNSLFWQGFGQGSPEHSYPSLADNKC